MKLHNLNIKRIETNFEVVSRRSGKIHTFQLTAALLGILLLAFGLRLHDLGLSSMWLDEVRSFNRASLSSWSEVYDRLLIKSHAPLYDAFLLHNWLRLGRDEFILRFPTVISSLAVIAVTFSLAKRLFTPMVGLISALLLSLASLSIFYAREVRMYSLAALFVVLALYLLARAIEPGASQRKRMLILYAIAVTLAIYTHYYTIVALSGVTIFAFTWATVRGDRSLLGQLLATYFAIGVLFAPWFPTLWTQLQSDPVTWIPVPTIKSISRIISGFFLDQIALGKSHRYLIILLTIVLVVGLFLYIAQRRRSGQNKWAFGLLFIFLAAIGPILIAIGISLIKPLIVARYFVPVLAPAAILLAVALAGVLQRRLTSLLALPLLAGLLVSAYGVSTVDTKQDWKGVAVYLSANGEPEDSILVAPVNNHVPLMHYYKGPIREILEVENNSNLPALFSRAAIAERLWTVTVRNEVSNRMIAYADSNLKSIECQTFGEKASFIDLCLYDNSPYKPVYHLPSPETLTFITWDQKLSLLGYDLPVIDQKAKVLPIKVYWQALMDIEESYIIYFHLIDLETGLLVAQADVIPRGWSYPTSWWSTNEVVEDTVQIPLKNVPPGRYELRIGLYDEETGKRLTPSSDQLQISSDGSTVITIIER